MSQATVWAIQAVLLTVGIYLFLRFARRARGSRLVRGLFTALILGGFGLWALTEGLQLEELRHILENVAGYVLLVLAIVFQPELRRAVGQLGESPLAGGGRSRLGSGTLEELAQALRSLASRRVGALIAIECQSPLESYVETGVRLDSPVSRILVESIFQPGGPLHDGALVVRGDRVVAALCILPLSESRSLTRSTGTRHRAALGLTEETDALTLAVSEETGKIALCRRGELHSDISPDALETAIREALGTSGTPGAAGTRGPGALQRLASGFAVARRDATWVLASLVLAVGVLFIAHQDISVEDPRTLVVRAVPASSSAQPLPGQLLVRLPGEDMVWIEDEIGRRVNVEVTGTRAQLQRLGARLAGEIHLPAGAEGWVTLEEREVRWRHTGPGLRVRWSGASPEVRVERMGRLAVPLGPEHLEVDDSRLNPRYEFERDGLRLSPAAIALRGPRSELERVERGELELRLERVALGPEHTTSLRPRLDLAPALRQRGLEFEGETLVEAYLPIAPARRDLGSLVREVALVCFDPQRQDELAHWRLPAHAQNARFSIRTQGLIPATAEAGTALMLDRATTLRQFVQENLAVYVDVADLPPEGEGRSVPVRWTWRRDWRDSLPALGMDGVVLGGFERLDVVLESEREVLLVPVERP